MYDGHAVQRADAARSRLRETLRVRVQTDYDGWLRMEALALQQQAEGKEGIDGTLATIRKGLAKARARLDALEREASG